MDLTSQVHPCPGREADFYKKSKVSTFRFLFAISTPFIFAGGIGYYIWRNWDGKYGRIRLGESSAFDRSNPWIRWPVTMLSAIVAVSVSMPLLAASVWRSLSGLFGRFSSSTYKQRDFSVRNTGAYSIVDNDEELLGEDSEDDD